MTHPALRRALPGFAVSAVGDGMSAVAVAWLALHLAAPADAGLVVGAAVAAYTLPGAAGAVAFARLLRGRPGLRLVGADALLRMASLGAISVLGATGALSVAVYVALLTVSSLLHAWGISGRYSFVAEQLPDEHRLAGNALLATMNMGSLVVGPALAGALIAVADAATTIGADAASFAVLAIATALASRHSTAKPSSDETAGMTTHVGSFRFLLGNPPIAGLIALTFVFDLLYGPVEVALPLYVAHDLDGTAALLSTFWAVFGAGAIAGGLSTGLLRRRPLGPTAVGIVLGWGAALVPVGLIDTAVPALVSFAVGGLIYAPYQALAYALVQRVSPPYLLTQVLAAMGAITVLAAPVGTALGAPIAATLGGQNTLLVSATATLALGLLAAATLLVTHQHRRRS